jgi:hypothetical protein
LTGQCIEVETLRRPTSTEQETTNANLLRDSVKVIPAGGITPAYSRYAATKNTNVVFLESLIHTVPDQTSPDHSSTGSDIIGHLGKPSGVYLDSLC